MLQRGLAFSPQQKIFGEQLLSDSPPSVVLEQELDNTYMTFWWVGWLNIGLVAARPVPTALVILCFPFTWLPLEL